MPFAPETQAILDRVEHITKLPIALSPDLQSPHLLAQVMMARGDSPAHFVRYKPNVPGVNYNLAFQCAFILRLYENPPSERFDFVGVDTGRHEVLRMMKGPSGIEGKAGITGDKLVGLASQMFDGIMLQMRSAPVGMRIDAWIFHEYPGLRDEQEASIVSQQQTNAKSLSPAARTVAPPTIYNANVAMNTAYALFADRLYERNLHAIPFRSAGFADRGQRLLDIFDEIPSDPSYDRNLADAFGDELGISDWFQWLPFIGPGDER